MFRYHKPIKKPIYCPNATHLGSSKVLAQRGDVVVYKEHYLDDSYRYRLGRVLALATHDGTGELFTETGPRGAVKPKPKLLVLAGNDTMSYAYERIVDREDIVEIRNAPNATFVAWLVGGDLPSTETILAASKYGSLSDHYFHKYADENGNLPENWIERDKVGT